MTKNLGIGTPPPCRRRLAKCGAYPPWPRAALVLLQRHEKGRGFCLPNRLPNSAARNSAALASVGFLCGARLRSRLTRPRSLLVRPSKGRGSGDDPGPHTQAAAAQRHARQEAANAPPTDELEHLQGRQEGHMAWHRRGTGLGCSDWEGCCGIQASYAAPVSGGAAMTPRQAHSGASRAGLECHRTRRRLAPQLALIRCGDCDPSVRLDWERAVRTSIAALNPERR